MHVHALFKGPALLLTLYRSPCCFRTALYRTALQMQQQYKTDEGGVVTEPYIAAIVSPYDRWGGDRLCCKRPSLSLAVPAPHFFQALL